MIIKNITFLTTCHESLAGCLNKRNEHKLLEIKVKIPLDKRDLLSNNYYDLTKYLEILTGFFVIKFLKINNKCIKD